MSVCPNKNSNEWKELVAAFGSEEEAMRAFMAAGNQVVTPEELGVSMPTAKKKVDQPTFSALFTNRKKSLRTLEQRLGRVEQEIKTAVPSDKVTLHKRAQLLHRNITRVEEELIEIRKTDALLEIEEYALKDFEELNNIFAQEFITTEDLTYAKNKIDLWEKAGNFTREHLFFTREELQFLDEGNDVILNSIRDKFMVWAGDAMKYHNLYTKIAETLVEEHIQKEFDFEGKVDFEGLIKDKGWTFTNLIDISEADHVLFQSLFQWNKKANHDARIEGDTIIREVEDLFKKATKDMTRKELHELFKQNYSNTDNRETGNMTFRWTQFYFDSQRDFRNKLYGSLEAIDEREDWTKDEKSAAKNKAYANYIKNLKNNTLAVDMRKLFTDETIEIDGKEESLYNKELFEKYYREYTQEEIDAHKAELKEHLGEKGYEFYLKEAKEKLNKYKDDYIAQRSILETEVENPEMELKHWEMTHSPFFNSFYYNNQVPRTKIGGNWVHSSSEYMTTIARKYDQKGNDTGFYDTKYEKIEANEATAELYDYIIRLTNELSMFLPPDKVEYMQINSLPEIRKNILEGFMSDGIKDGLRSTWDILKESTRIDDLSTEIGEEKLDIHGKPERQLQTQFLINNAQKINDYIKLRQIEYEQKHGVQSKKQLRELRLEWKKEISDQLSREKSWDIEKIIKAYTMMSLLYKHKARVQDTMQLTSNLIDNLRQAQLNDAGEQQYKSMSEDFTGEKKKPIPDKKGDLKNLRSMVDNLLDVFYGYSTTKAEGKLKKRVYTSKELKFKKDIEVKLVKNDDLYNKKEITEERYMQIKETLEEQLVNLGGQATASKMGTWVLKYMQIKGMGWNVFSAFANIGFGTIANFVEADGGQRFTRKQLWKGYRLILNSIGKNYTFNQMGGSTATKIRSLMDKLDILKESKNEIFQTKMMNNKLKFLDPYNMQSRGEYINQGTLMIAIMLNTKIPGTDMNLWDAYDKNGELKEGVELPKDFEFKITSKIDEAVRYLHGNYDPNAPLKVKNNFIGKAASQFRTWAYMGFYNRFGSETKSHIVGFTKKGRYRSYATIFGELGAFPATIEITKQLIRKMTFQKTTFDEKLNEVDAANLRKNLTEIALLAITTSLGLTFKALAKMEDGDDDEELWRFLAIFWTNQMSRLSTDILLYTSPTEFEKIQRQAIPLFTVVVDASKLISHVASLTVGGEDEYQAGLYHGESKTWRYSKNLIPGLTQWNRLQTTAKRIY